MNDVSKELLTLLDLEPLELNLFRGIGTGGETSTRIFGGHVIAQALAAAYRTVEERMCHSLHAYFVRPGDPSMPVFYQVDRTRDGGSFTTRRIVAVQNGKQILTMSASFHIQEEGWHHQHEMPSVAGPEGLLERAELRAGVADQLSEKHRDDFLRQRPIEVREIAPRDFFNPAPEDDVNHMWFRMPAAKGTDIAMQHCLLAYASDLNLLGSSLRPHGLSWFKKGVMSASLDHAMWFHAPVRFENWHLYTMDSPFSGGARGFNRGSVYTQEGALVASVAQEGLIRKFAPRN